MEFKIQKTSRDVGSGKTGLALRDRADKIFRREQEYKFKISRCAFSFDQVKTVRAQMEKRKMGKPGKRELFEFFCAVLVRIQPAVYGIGGVLLDRCIL